MTAKEYVSLNLKVTLKQREALDELASRMEMRRSEALRYLLTMLPDLYQQLLPETAKPKPNPSAKTRQGE